MTCKKVKFADEKAALFYIKKIKDTSTKVKRPTAAYLCPHCLAWHLTSRTQKDDMQIEKYRETIKHQKEHIKNLEARIIELKGKLKINY